MQYYKPKAKPISSIGPRDESGKAVIIYKNKVIGYNLFQTSISVVVPPKPVYRSFEMQAIWKC